MPEATEERLREEIARLRERLEDREETDPHDWVGVCCTSCDAGAVQRPCEPPRHEGTGIAWTLVNGDWTCPTCVRDLLTPRTDR